MFNFMECFFGPEKFPVLTEKYLKPVNYTKVNKKIIRIKKSKNERKKVSK